MSEQPDMATEPTAAETPAEPTAAETPAEPTAAEPTGPRNADSWARPVDRLSAKDSEKGFDPTSVDGRRIAGPIQGFGKMWQKTYTVALADADVAPQQVIADWKKHYGEFWPKGNRFQAPLAGLQPGEVGLITGKAGGLKLSTGVLVLYSDDESFSFMTPEGHPFAGMITFSAHGAAPTTAQVQLLIRAQDPMVELGMALGGHRKEDQMWIHTLTQLAHHFGVEEPAVDKQVVCVDRKRQWRRAGNIRHDAVLHTMTRPFRRSPKPAADPDGDVKET